MKININSETGTLKSVILGIANDRNKQPKLNNPKYTEIVKRGEEPTEAEMVREMELFRAILEENGVDVFRPQNIPNYDQLFCRDIGFVIGDHFFIANMRKKNRQQEIEAFRYLVDQFENVHFPPTDAIIEGGDVIVWKQYVFVGHGDRTNEAGIHFLKEVLAGEKEVIPLQIKVTDDPQTNMLHLDCAFQPIGLQYGLIYKEGFVDSIDPIYDVFSEKNLIEVSQEEMYDMVPNVFSIHPEKVVIEKHFTRLAKALQKRNIEPISIEYHNVSKLGGLLRCSTCPLERVDLG